MAASDKVVQGMWTAIDDGRNVVNRQFVRSCVTRLARWVVMGAIDATPLGGINHGLSLLRCNIVDGCITAASFSGKTEGFRPRRIGLSPCRGSLANLYDMEQSPKTFCFRIPWQRPGSSVIGSLDLLRIGSPPFLTRGTGYFRMGFVPGTLPCTPLSRVRLTPFTFCRTHFLSMLQTFLAGFGANLGTILSAGYCTFLSLIEQMGRMFSWCHRITPGLLVRSAFRAALLKIGLVSTATASVTAGSLSLALFWRHGGSFGFRPHTLGSSQFGTIALAVAGITQALMFSLFGRHAGNGDISSHKHLSLGVGAGLR